MIGRREPIYKEAPDAVPRGEPLVLGARASALREVALNSLADVTAVDREES
jgi:hypothetical protein